MINLSTDMCFALPLQTYKAIGRASHRKVFQNSLTLNNPPVARGVLGQPCLGARAAGHLMSMESFEIPGDGGHRGAGDEGATPADERDDPRTSQETDPKTGRSDDPRVDPAPGESDLPA